jgi:cytochrome P450
MESEALHSGTTFAPDYVDYARSRRQMPGPKTRTRLGWYIYALSRINDPVMALLKLQEKYGDVVSLGPDKGAPVIIFGPKYNHQVMSDPNLFYCLDTSSKESLIHMPEGSTSARLLAGVTGMNGPKHAQHRRLLMPAFHKKRVEALRDTIVEQVELHVDRWRPGMRINLQHEMLDLSMALAVSGLLGLDPAKEGGRVRQLLELWSERGLSPQVALLPYDVPGLPYRRFQEVSEQLEVELRNVIAHKRAVGTEAGDALSLLIDARDEDGSTLTDDDLLGHLSTLFTAGHETTASSLTWTLFLLSQHPRVMHDLMDEMDSKLKGRAPTIEQMYSELPVLDGVVNESLRMFPPGMWIYRRSAGPFQLGPHKLPKGTHVIFSPAATHYRTDIYEEPHRFMPERWSKIDPNTYEYLPFGGGPRRCLGATFAHTELRMALPIILQRFRIEVPQGARVDRSGTVLSFPKGGLDVYLREQDRNFSPSNVRGNIHDLVRLG